MLRRSTILLLMPHLGGGGAERVMSLLARSLPCDSFDVHVGLMTEKSCPEENLPPRVHVHGLGARRVLFGAIGLLRLVWQLHPDLIISGMFHLNFLVLLLRPLFPRATRVLVRQNGMLPARTDRSRSRAVLGLYRATYPHANGIICQTPAMAEDIVRLVGLSTKLHVLRNPVDLQEIRQLAARSPRHWSGNGPHLLAVGRLCVEKGFDLLLDGFATLRRHYPSADLAILGQGAEEKALRTRCNALGLTACVFFEGYVDKPASWFAGASLLVIPSREEAFPNILLEGAAAGLPIVTTPCSPGVTQLLHGQSGTWLARNVSSDALTKSLIAALATLRPGERFRHLWLDPFELHKAVAEYETLIDKTLRGPAR
jgi:glycosyltransferase involved in cell wall biosynthesis